MKPAPHLTADDIRLRALRDYQLLDTLPEQALDDLTALAAHICQVPVSLISLVDENRQWFKSKIGLAMSQTSRDVSFCGHAIGQPGVFIVNDTLADEAFADNPLVTGEPHIRFYAGAPLVTSDGQAIGTLCVIDQVPRALTPLQYEALRILARQVMAQLDLRRRTRELVESEAQWLQVFHNGPAALALHRYDDRRFVDVNAAFTHLFGWTVEDVVGRTPMELGQIDAEHSAPFRARLQREGALHDEELTLRTREGAIRHVVISTELIELRHGPHSLTMYVDITPRKQAEMAARRLAAIVESSDDGIIGRDLHGVVTSWNRGAERLFGYGADKMVGTSIMRLIPENRRGEDDFILGQITSGQSVESFETERLSRDGRLIPVSITASPIKDADGRIVGVSKIVRDITGRKAVEEELRERDEQLRLYVEHSPAAIAMFDREMNYLLISRQWRMAYRMGDASYVGRCHYDVFPDIPDRWREVHRRCLAGAIESAEEDRFERADGEVYWRRWEIRPWSRTDGSIGGIIIISEDVTARKRSEEAIKRSEERYRTLFEYAPDGILIADPQSYYLDANASMCRMLGLERTALIGMHASDIVAPVEVAQVEPALEAIKGEGDYRREWRFKRQDGSTFAADVIATQMPDGNILAMIRDVTERNRATEALRAADERVRFALQSANIGIWDVDYGTGMTRWSDIAEAQHGLKPGTFGGTAEDFLDRVHPDDRAALTETMEKATRSGADFTTEHRALWPDGTVRWLNGAGRVQFDGHGRPVRSVGISIDVTERRLLERQYQQAQKMEAVGRLAGGIAHDFNNLLTAILGYCELLLGAMAADDPRTHDVVEVQKASQQAAALTRQLLAFSRKQIVEPMSLDLNLIVTEMRSMVGRLIGEDVTIAVHLDPDLGRVRADRSQIEQVVLNLVVNARDAMAHGGTLTIETKNADLDEHQQTQFAVAPGRYVRLAISDTGVGMSPAVQTRLFEPFFTTKELGKGTGLGLATVHGIVTQIGGTVSVYSEVGQGTIFKIYLPRSGDAERAVTPKRRSREVSSERYTILVVEDAEGLQELTKRLLERLGHRALVAANAAEARVMFQAHPEIDLLLTDVVMPGESGADLARALLTLRPDLRVIYMSGYTEDAMVTRGLLDSEIAFLHKPFTSEMLGRKISDAGPRQSSR